MSQIPPPIPPATSIPYQSNAGGTLDSDSKTFGILAHVAAFAGCVIPFGNIIGPLVIWLIKKDKLPYVDHHGKEALNFNICFTIYLIAAWLTIFILIGFLLLPAVGIAWLVLVILATIKASNGEMYRYPLIFRLVK